MNSEFPKLILQSVLGCGLCIAYSGAAAQECGGLPEESCGRVATAISNWDTRISSSAGIQEWRYLEEIGGVQLLIEKLDEDDAFRVASVDGKGNVVIEELNVQQQEQWRVSEHETLKSLVNSDGNRAHLVELLWNSSGGDFKSTVIASDEYPYLYGRILSSIVLESNSNSCVYIRLLWLWGTTRGEIFADLVPYGEGEESFCARIYPPPWMILGDARVEMGDVTYKGEYCKSPYAWAYGTPLASISITRDPLSFQVSGLGSRASANGDCVKPMH